MNRVIKIEQGNEFKVSVNKSGIEEKDFFYSQYAEAKRHVMTIVESTKAEGNFDADKECLNNIISFCGERGSGKTTAMKTFAQSLCGTTNKLPFFKELGSTTFYSLKSIDPSCFESNHHVLDIIISLMFKDFESIYKEGISDSEKYKTLEQFQVVYRNLTALRNKKKYQEFEYDYEGDVQKLSNIASDINLKEHLFELIESYLEIKKADFLVLMIDDLDINARFAYEIAEEIRRYLNIPNVIVIMAIRIEQLSDCVRKELLIDFKPLIDNDKKYNMELSRMVNKYLNKLIPESRRIQLPDLRVVSINAEDLFEIEYNTNQSENSDLISKLSTDGKNTAEITILKYIFDMTEIVLVHEHQKVHPIVPSTMRELVILYDYLGRMKKGNVKDNITLFKQYFMDVWCKNNLNEYTLDIVTRWDVQQLKDKNKFISEQIKILLEAFINQDENTLMLFKGYNTAVYKQNMNNLFSKTSYAERQLEDYSFSIGDVLNLLMDVNTIVKNDEVDKFISGCYLMYSILLNELKYNTKDAHTVLREEGIMQPNEVNTIVSGSLWGEKLNELLPKFTEKNGDETIEFSRCKFNCSGIDIINDIFTLEIKDTNGSYSIGIDNYKNIIEKDKNSFLLLGVLLNFGFKNRKCNWRNTFFSDNYTIKPKAEFSLDSIFMIGIDTPFAYEKMEYELYKINSHNAEGSKIISNYGINETVSKYIVHNLELSRLLLKDCIDRRGFSRSSNNQGIEHYKNLFGLIDKSLEKVLGTYEVQDRKLSMNDDRLDKIIEHFHDAAKKYQGNKSTSEIPVLHVNKASEKLSITGFLNRCNVLLKNIEVKEDEIKNAEEYVREINNLINSLDKENTGERTPIESIVVYNRIWNIIRGLE